MPSLTPKAEGREYPITLIHGPSGSGKTRVAATASAQFQLRPTAERNSLIELTDLVWLQFDKDGIQTLQSLGLEPYYCDFSQMPTADRMATWVVAVTSKLEEVKKLIVEKDIKYVVVDTISALAEYLECCLVPTAKDPRQGFYAAQNTMRALLLSLRQLPCRQIWLSHSKTAYNGQETEEQKARKEAALPGEYKVDLGLTYGMATTLRKHFSLVMGLDADAKTGKRELVTSENNGMYYAKSRYGDLLQPREPADLRQVFNKIEAFEQKLYNK